MLEQTGNLWDIIKVGRTDIDLIPCIPTNGSINSQGFAVMGRGVAWEAAIKFPSLPEMLARKIQEEGNRVHMFLPFPGHYVLTFPVKHRFDQNADLNLIQKSAWQLKTVAKFSPSCTFYLPRPGCGNGHLDWKDVKPIVEHLPDNVIILSL